MAGKFFQVLEPGKGLVTNFFGPDRIVGPPFPHNVKTHQGRDPFKVCVHAGGGHGGIKSLVFIVHIDGHKPGSTDITEGIGDFLVINLVSCHLEEIPGYGNQLLHFS